MEIRTDIREIRAELRDFRKEMAGAFESVRASIESMRSSIDSLRASLEGVRESHDRSIDTLKDSIANAKIGGVLLYVALAGTMLLTMAKGFKWL